MSWTLSNYSHGRRYTSFFADRRTDLNELDLNPSGQAATRELLSLSPRHEIRVIVALTTANVSLFGPLHDVTDVNERVLCALRTLTESLAPAVELAFRAGA